MNTPTNTTGDTAAESLAPAKHLKMEAPLAVPAPPSTALAAPKEFRLGLEPENIESAMKLCATIARTGICGLKSAEDALSRVLTGRALGLPLMVSIRKIKTITIDGSSQPWLDSDLVLALCLQHPLCEYFDMIESTKEKATFTAKRKGRPAVTMTFTIEEARDALLVDRGETPERAAKNNYNRWRAQMLRSRCITNLAKIVVPEAAMGMGGGDDGDADEGNVITINEKTGEVLHETKPTPPASAAVQVPSRNYDAEVAALKTTIDAATTPADRAAVRARIKACDIPTPWADEITAHYNATIRRPPTAANTNHSPASGGPTP